MTSLLEAADVSLAQIGSEGVIVAVDRDPLSQCCGLAPPPLSYRARQCRAGCGSVRHHPVRSQ